MIILDLKKKYSKLIKRKTYQGVIRSLKDHQIFVFGSNAEGRHSKGSALVARMKYGAIYGQPEGAQGQSYAIVTKDLTKKKHPSISISCIKRQIKDLYKYAKDHPDNEFWIVYRANTENLNGYTDLEMVDMFKARSVPMNIIFEEEFNKLIFGDIDPKFHPLFK